MKGPEQDHGHTGEPHGKGETQLVLTHAQLPDQQAVASHTEGWTDIVRKLGDFVHASA